MIKHHGQSCAFLQGGECNCLAAVLPTHACASCGRDDALLWPSSDSDLLCDFCYIGTLLHERTTLRIFALVAFLIILVIGGTDIYHARHHAIPVL